MCPTMQMQIRSSRKSLVPDPKAATLHALHTCAQKSLSVVLTVNAYKAYTIMVFESLIWLHG